MATNLRRYEQRLRALLRLWMVLFVGMGVVLLVLPRQLVTFLNAAGTAIGWPGPTLTPPTDYFFSILAASLLVVLTVLCRGAREDLRRRLPAVRAILLSKLVTTGGFTIALFAHTFAFAYFVGAATDGLIALWTFAYYRHVRYVI